MCLSGVFKSRSALLQKNQVVSANLRVTRVLLNETINISAIATRIVNIVTVVIILLGFEPNLIASWPTQISIVAPDRPDTTIAIKCLIIIQFI